MLELPVPWETARHFPGAAPTLQPLEGMAWIVHDQGTSEQARAVILGPGPQVVPRRPVLTWRPLPLRLLGVPSLVLFATSPPAQGLGLLLVRSVSQSEFQEVW